MRDEEEVAKYNLWKGLPPQEIDVYHQGLNDELPRTEYRYGRRRIVWRIERGNPALTREQAQASAKKSNVVYEELFPTARYWCFCVFE